MDVNRRVEMLYKTKYRLFLSIGRTHGLSEDAAFDSMQTAFVKALQKKKRIESMSDSELRAYVLTIMRHECCNHYRTEKRYSDLNTNENADGKERSVLEHVVDTSASPLDELILREERHVRNHVILKLPEKYRRVVELSLDGYKRNDIARILNIEKTNIQNLKHRGLKRYYSIMGKMAV